jgi:hypothetical protein
MKGKGLGASQSAIERPSHIWVSPCAAVSTGHVGVTRSSVSRRAPPRGGRQVGLEPGAVGLALDDEVVGAAGEAIEGALRADGIGEGGEPFIGPAVAGDDQRAGAVAFEEDLIGVAALLGLHGVEGEVVEDQEVDGEELAEFGLVTLGEAGVLEGLEQRVRAEGEDGVAAAGDVARAWARKLLPTPTGPTRATW